MEYRNRKISWNDIQPEVERRPGINKLILWVLNLLLVGPLCIADYSLIGVITAGVVSGLLALLLFTSRPGFSASAFLPVVALGDILIYTGIHFEELKVCYEQYGLAAFRISSTMIYCCAAVVFFGIIGLASKGAGIWCGGLAGVILGSIVIFSRFGGRLVFSGSDLLSVSFTFPQGTMLYSLFLFTSLLWIVMMHFNAIANRQKRKLAAGIGVIVLLITCAYVVVVPNYLLGKAGAWQQIFYQELSGWRLPAVCGVLLLIIMLLSLWNHGVSTPDVYAAALGLELIIAVKMASAFYFKYHFLLLLLLLIGTFRCMKNDFCGRKTLHLRSAVYLSVQMAAYALILIMISCGLWINLVLTIVFAILLYKTCAGKKHASYAVWNLVLICIFCEALGYLWTRNWTVMNGVIAAAGFLAAMFGMWAVHRKAPYEKKYSPTPKLVVCGVLLCICVLSAVRNVPQISSAHSVFQINAMGGNLVIARLEDQQHTGTSAVYWKNKWEGLLP